MSKFSTGEYVVTKEGDLVVIVEPLKSDLYIVENSGEKIKIHGNDIVGILPF